MIKLVVAGAAGRMGKTILTLAGLDSAFRIVAGLEQEGNRLIGTEIGPWIGASHVSARIIGDPDEALASSDVLIDFTHPSALPMHLEAAIAAGAGYVLGTTGLTSKDLRLVQTAAKKIPVVQSPNMSVGVNLLFKLAELTSRALDERYDIEITETHHRMKKDAPSGTAMKLLEIIAQARKRNPGKDTVYGRKGETGVRPAGKIGVLALRGGDVVGDHTVFFLGDGERIELTHKASSRDAFALGALKAAKFVVRRKRGLYNMSQVLGIA
ncbi:MAG: 4-hydroxy-tetrahydrodipicolinate reductase [Omnitrophica bacterium GWA2_52_8]|nr:MAG: 4-hydroxy-tetrahydrodipicolinate reductase [Omnitrophica bacterium GWA2_52_8]